LLLTLRAPRLPRAPPFPSTTLFRSAQPVRVPQLLFGLVLLGVGVALLLSRLDIVDVSFWDILGTWWPLLIIAAGLAALGTVPRRSEEHTSELQSRENLVCRLLLEKN